MFGLMTKAAHEEAVAAAKMDAAIYYQGKVAALESQIADLTRALANIKARLSERSAMVERLKPHAEKELARAARAKDYEANKRVRKPRAKRGAA